MAKNGEVSLGDRVKDTVTGFSGICVAITSWLNGCRRIGVQSTTALKDGMPVDLYTVDEHQINVIEPLGHKPNRRTGGPQNDQAMSRR